MSDQVKTQEQTRLPSAGNWLERMVEELLAKGWKIHGLDSRQLPMLLDPAGQLDQATGDIVIKNVKGREVPHFEPRQTTDVPLKTRDGNVETFRQVVGPPVQWAYKVEEAYAMQRQREEWAAKQAADEERKQKQAQAKQQQQQPAGNGPKMVSSTSGRK